MPADALPSPQPDWNPLVDLQILLEYHFMANALVAGTVVAVLCGVLGYFVVLRGQTFATHTLAQMGFPGAAGAALVGVAPLDGLLVACAAAACAIAALGAPLSGGRRAEQAAIGSILALALALGFLFASLSSGFVSGVQALLFGTFLGISDSQVLTLVIVAVVALGTLGTMGRRLLFASLEPEAAAARGVHLRPLGAAFLLVLGLAVALTAQITGTLLVFALLVTPAAAAQRITTRPWLGILLSVLIGVGVVWVGVGIAYFSIRPVGFYITSVAFAVYLVARCWSPVRDLARRMHGDGGHRGERLAATAADGMGAS